MVTSGISRSTDTPILGPSEVFIGIGLAQQILWELFFFALMVVNVI
jgi:hypothetical protein